MRVSELIDRKRRGFEMTPEEIRYLVLGFARDEVPDYQMAAWLMAVCFVGMTPGETAELTMAMIDSGEQVDLSSIPGVKVDKHSTGGVGDKTTLVLAPLVASCGVPVAKMSGRGLGHTGGTLDKLESIPGFQTNLTRERFLDQVRRIGIALAGQTKDLVPADGAMYALRDVTATVESLPLIASSIMSKKIAGGAGAILLDVKAGGGAFMRTLEAARELAVCMVEIGRGLGRPTRAMLTGMDQPLGQAVGNSLEVLEAVQVLEGRGPQDLRELSLALGAEMLALAGRAGDVATSRVLLEKSIGEGLARRKLEEMVEAQGGDPGSLSQDGLPVSLRRLEVKAIGTGVVVGIEAREIGLAAMALGAGRMKKGDPVDPGVGLILNRKIGDAVSSGDSLATLFFRSEPEAEIAAARVRLAYKLGDQAIKAQQLILDKIG